MLNRTEMRVIYDESVDILYIRLREAKYYESEEVREGLIVDVDRKGRPLAIEIHDASELLGKPEAISVEFSRRGRTVGGGKA